MLNFSLPRIRLAETSASGSACQKLATPDFTLNGLHSKKTPHAEKELERIAAILRKQFGQKLPGLRVEVLEKLSGYYDRLQQPEGIEN